MNLSRVLFIVCCLSPLILVVSYAEPVQSAGDYYDSLDPAGEEIVACNFYRKANSDAAFGATDTVYKEAQTWTITKNYCDNLADQQKDPSGYSWDPDDYCFKDTCDMEHEEDAFYEEDGKLIPAISNSGFVGSKTGQGPTGEESHLVKDSSHPWEGWSVKTPPACPYDISKLSGSDWEYCRCGDTNHRISDGGKCTENGPHPEERLCEDLEECGDYELKELYNLENRLDFDNDVPLTHTWELSPTTVDITQPTKSREGRFTVNTWLYVSEEKENVGIDSYLGDTFEVSLSKLDLSSHTSASDNWEFEETFTKTFSEPSFEDVGTLERGWYLMELSWNAEGHFGTLFSFTLEGGDAEIGEIAETVNWKGPIPRDLNRYNDPEKAKEACKNHPYFGTDFSDEWAQSEWESVDDKNRLCCGNKGSQDYGMANPVTDETCTSDGWSDEVAKCYDGGSAINGTHFSPEIDACCGAAAGDEGDGGEEVFKSCEVQNSDCSVYTDNPITCNAIDGCTYNPGELREDDTDLNRIEDPVTADCEGTVESSYCVGQDESTCTSRTACNAVYETEDGEEVTDNYGNILEKDESSDNYHKYVCLKNRRSETDFDPVVENESTWHVWRNVNDTKDFKNLEVMKTRDDTQYVSDNTSWYTCANTGRCVGGGSCSNIRDKEQCQTADECLWDVSQVDQDEIANHTINTGETTNTVSREGYEGQAICHSIGDAYGFRECCAGEECSNSGSEL